MTESIAADGTGIRETFVYAVRLALDRVRELMSRRALPTAPTGPNSADELLAALRPGRARRAPPVIERGPGSVATELLRAVVPRLSQIAQLLLDADDRLARLPLALPCNLDGIGALDGLGVYIGLMPEATAAPAGPRPRSDPRALLRGQLEPATAMDLRDRALDLDDVLARLPGGFPPAEGIIPALSALLRA